MLVAFAKTAGRKAAPVSRAQIKKRGYATVLRGLNEEVAVLDTTVLEQVLANKEGLKSLEQAYKDALASQGVARNEIISSIQKEFGNSPYAAVRRASDGFVSALNRVNSSTDVEAAKFSLPLANIDEVLEVHEIAQLTNAYAQAFSQLPYVPTQTAIPIDEITSAFAPATAELKAAEAHLDKIIIKTEAQLHAASQTAIDLMYSKADDYLSAHPNLEAQLDQEILENRWDLLLKDDA